MALLLFPLPTGERARERGDFPHASNKPLSPALSRERERGMIAP